MINKAIEYPHPVLNEYTNDFVDCSFALELISHNDTGSTLELGVNYVLNCNGLLDLLSKGKAKVNLRVTCFRTSYRTSHNMSLSGTTTVSIPKKYVTEAIDLQAIIVAADAFTDYSLPEFNKVFFGDKNTFSVRKGDILANEPGIKIKLDTALEKNMAGVVLINRDDNITEMKVHYAAVEDEDPQLTDYIIITLPKGEYINYGKLTTKKHLKHGIERFLQCAVVLPALVEAVSILTYEEMTEDDELERHHNGTVWAKSIYASLEKQGVNELASCSLTAYEIANRLLGDVVQDAINNLMQKMEEWSTIRQEDEAL